MDLFSLIITVCLGNYCESNIDEHNVTLDDCNQALIVEVGSNKLTTELYYQMIANRPLTSLESVTTRIECIGVDTE